MRKLNLIIFLGILLAISIFLVLKNPEITGNVILEGEDYKCPDCNVILISIDTLRADHLSCYGYKRNTTPNICKLAEQGVLFENAYSPAPSTVPTLRAIMSGKSISNENKNETISYYKQTPFLAEIIKQKGYETAGFTDHKGVGSESRGFRKGFETFKNHGTGVWGVNSHLLTADVLDWLEQNYERQFFLWVHYFDPHDNYNPFPEYESKFGFSRISCSRIYNGIDIKEIRKIGKDLTKKEIDCIISLYDAEIFYTDEYIGKLLDKIKDLGLEKNTLIIITADHGEEFMERSRIGHETSVYNELIHVPLVIKTPHSQAPKIIKENFATQNIFNIILNIVYDNKFQADKYVISRKYPFYVKKQDRFINMYTIIYQNYKYIYTPKTGKEEFYNLKDDPEEKNNLLNSIWKEKLKNELIKWINKNNIKIDVSLQENNDDNKIREEILKSLGYMN